MFNNHPITASLLLSILASSSALAQEASSADVVAAQREPTGMGVSVLGVIQGSKFLSATLRIDNATNHDLIFSAASKGAAWVSLHAGGLVVPGKVFVETDSYESESNTLAESHLVERVQLSPEDSRTIHVRFGLSDTRESRQGFQFIEVTGSQGGRAISASVALVVPTAHAEMEGNPWDGG
jgi:hypothetical protein